MRWCGFMHRRSVPQHRGVWNGTACRKPATLPLLSSRRGRDTGYVGAIGLGSKAGDVFMWLRRAEFFGIWADVSPALRRQQQSSNFCPGQLLNDILAQHPLGAGVKAAK